MITLVLGGARSGKSAVAERLAERLADGSVTYVATGVATDGDMAARIAAHRARRPPGWSTVEAAGGDLQALLCSTRGVVVLDALGTWMAAATDFAVDADGLCRALVGREGDTVVVSEEVGLGVHPSTDVGRRFRDALGTLNEQVASVADDVLLVVAGRSLALERP